MYNDYATVPSLHLGFALAVSVTLGAWTGAPLAAARVVVGAARLAVVVATGNHFVPTSPPGCS